MDLSTLTGALPLPRDASIAREQRHFFLKVYLWMSAGLAVSGITAAWVASRPDVARLILGDGLIFRLLLILEVLLVLGLGLTIGKLSGAAAQALFILYSFTSGLTLSVIFFVYSASSIVSLFFTTAGVFAIMGAYGFFTDHDLTSWGHVRLSGLLGLVLASVVNLFARNAVADFWISAAGVLIFTGLIAYDTQKLRQLDAPGTVEGSDQEDREAIMGALELYLDFVNLFLKLLRLFGKKR